MVEDSTNQFKDMAMSRKEMELGLQNTGISLKLVIFYLKQMFAFANKEWENLLYYSFLNI